MSNVITSLSPFFAIVEEVNVEKGELLVRAGAKETDTFTVLAPALTGMGGGESGVYSPSITPGSTVLCQNAYSTSREDVFVIGVMPTEFLKSDDMEVEDRPSGSSKYPTGTMEEGDVRIVGQDGGELFIKNNKVEISNTAGSGFGLIRKGEESSHYISAESHYHFSDGGNVRSGAIKRVHPNVRPLRPQQNSTNNVGNDMGYLDSSEDRGLFAGNISSKTSGLDMPRNPRMAENRRVSYEFVYSDAFLGFDVEEKQISSDKPVVADADAMKKISRVTELGNSLYLAPHELIEVIEGNVVDIYGNSYDINYGTVLFGGKNATVPQSNTKVKMEESRRASRRGIGYHFQLSTNSRSTDGVQSNSNFLYDIDKEGVLKVNIPKSTNSGNIPFVSSTNFLNNQGSTTTEAVNKSVKEPIPVTLRSSTGKRVYPEMGVVRDAQRHTGVRFSNSDEYFPGGEGTVRVNTTKHHNMYAAAERLIANAINDIVIPFTNNECGFVYGNIHTDGAFERSHVGIDLDGKDKGPLHMGYVFVEPGAPAIDPGGGPNIVVAGLRRTAPADKKGNPINLPFSNSFTISDDLSMSVVDGSGEKRLPSGGRSLNANLEGSLELSIGKDNHDQKSFVLDTAGSLVSWFGKDRNGRSVVMQTDGSMLVNVGGSYDSQGVMNKGEFVLRVNVVDKGTVDDDQSKKTFNHESDFTITISDAGMVIAGMKSGAPMIIRNNHDIMIESSTKILMAAPQISDRTGSKPEKPLSKDQQSGDTSGDEGGSITPDQIVNKMQCIADVLEILGKTLAKDENA